MLKPATRRLPRAPTRAAQRGLSIVETMVGITVGLFVVAAAALLTSAQLSSNRKLLLEAQIQQDLRATADIIGRELRRSGALRDAQAINTTWRPGFVPSPNTAATGLQPAAGVTDDETQYQYERFPGAGLSTFGFRLENGRIRSRVGGGGWQDLTDATVMEVTTFQIATTGSTAEILPCPNECPGGGTACWPSVQVRDLTITLEARSTADASVLRSIRAVVRQRADVVARGPGVTVGFCPP